MCKRGWFATRAMGLAAAGLGVSAGCAHPVSNPWTFSKPAAVATKEDYARPAQPGRAVIVVAEFENPASPQLNWPNVGAGMSDALRRALRNEGDFEVRVDARLKTPPPRSAEEASPVDLGVDFLLTGRVTDFHHTSQLPKHVSRRALFLPRSEAVVAIDWRVIDVRARRVIAADHTYGTADSGRRSVKKLYEGLDFSAYLFWNTPMGKAAREAIEKTIDRLRDLVPAEIGAPAIVKVTKGRKVTVTGGWSWGLASGQEYYVTARHGDEGSPRTVYDIDTRRPLLVRIAAVKKDTSTAWLLGKPPAEADLRGARLVREPAASPLAREDRAGLQQRPAGGG